MTKIERLYNEERDLAVKNARKEEQLRIATKNVEKNKKGLYIISMGLKKIFKKII